MPLSMSRAALPTLVQILGALDGLLDKASAFCEERKIDPAILAGYRLAPDMFTLARQIQVATDQAKGCVARLAGIESPSFPDTETDLVQLKARLARTLDFLHSVPADQVDGSEERVIEFKAGSRELSFTGERYLLHWVLPNFMFHAVTAYDILRHAGVPLGKRDFLGTF
jgi:hypothetical protein